MPQIGGREGRGNNGRRQKPPPDWVKVPDPYGKTFTCFRFKDDQRGRRNYTKEAGYRGVFNVDKLKGKNAKALSGKEWSSNPMQRGFTPFKPMGTVHIPTEGKHQGQEITTVTYNDGAHRASPTKFSPLIKRKRPFGSTALPCTDEFSSVVRCIQHRRAIAKQIKTDSKHESGSLRADSCPPITLSGWESREDVTPETVEEIARCTRSSAGSYGFGCSTTDRIRKTFNRRPGINTSFGGDPATTLAMRFRDIAP